MLFESFEKVLNDDRISEIVISDDCSDLNIYRMIQERVKEMPKVKLFRTDTNMGCYRNKRHVVSLAENKWVILFDSDNIVTKDYIDSLFSHHEYWNYDQLLQPCFAKPHFDFRQFSGMFITRDNVHQYARNPTFTTALNAMNYFVNRDEYLKVWDADMKEPWTADSIYQNMRWLEAGNSIYFCPGLEYEHRVHDGSHYKEHNRKTGNLYNEVVNKLKAMR